MNERWHRTQSLVGLPGMPGERSIRLHGARRGWVSRESRWGRRTILEWNETSLPLETQTALRLARGESAPDSSLPGPEADGGPAGRPPSAVSLADDGPAALADARMEIVAAFRRWRAKRPALARDDALRKWASIYKKSGAGCSDGTRALIPAAAWNTVRRWLWASERRGVEGLLNGAGGRTSGIDADPELRDYIEAKIRANPRHVTAKNIMRAVAARFPDRETPSISTIRRWSRRFRAENAFDLSASEPDRHRSRTMPAFGSESEAIAALNALWELDSTRIDVMCADGKRQALVAAIDVWSRRARVLVTPQSRSTAIAALIRRCMLGWGVPEWIRTDEGADYTSKHLRRVLGELDIAHQVLPPYRPDKKPFIERFIGTLGRDLFAEMPGFTGHNVAQAQLLRERKSFAARRGEDWTVTFRTAMTAEELQRHIDSWCDNVYGREPHSGLDGQSPFARATGWNGERRTVDERGLDVLLAPAAGDGRRKVGKSGIRVDGGTYIAGELGRHTDQWVHVRQDPADLGRIHVFTEPDERARIRFLCIAEDPARTGIDRKAVAAEAKRHWRTKSNAARKRTRELEKAQDPTGSLEAVLDKAGDDAAAVVAFPARGAPHSTGAMEEAAKAEEAAQRAAQAERDGIAGKPTSDVALFMKFYGEKDHG